MKNVCAPGAMAKVQQAESESECFDGDSLVDPSQMIVLHNGDSQIYQSGNNAERLTQCFGGGDGDGDGEGQGVSGGLQSSCGGE